MKNVLDQGNGYCLGVYIRSNSCSAGARVSTITDCKLLVHDKIFGNQIWHIHIIKLH